MNATVDCAVEGLVQGLRLATTERHVRNGTLVRSLASLPELIRSSLRLRNSLFNSPNNTSHDVAHSTAAVTTEHLDSDNVCCLSDTVRTRRDGTCAVRPVSVRVDVLIVLGNGLAPMRTTLKLNVINIDTGVDDVDINALATARVVLVLGEGTEGELGTVAYPRKTLNVRSIIQQTTSQSASLTQGACFCVFKLVLSTPTASPISSVRTI